MPPLRPLRVEEQSLLLRYLLCSDEPAAQFAHLFLRSESEQLAYQKRRRRLAALALQRGRRGWREASVFCLCDETNAPPALLPVAHFGEPLPPNAADSLVLALGPPAQATAPVSAPKVSSPEGRRTEQELRLVRERLETLQSQQKELLSLINAHRREQAQKQPHQQTLQLQQQHNSNDNNDNNNNKDNCAKRRDPQQLPLKASPPSEVFFSLREKPPAKAEEPPSLSVQRSVLAEETPCGDWRMRRQEAFLLFEQRRLEMERRRLCALSARLQRQRGFGALGEEALEEDSSRDSFLFQEENGRDASETLPLGDLQLSRGGGGESPSAFFCDEEEDAPLCCAADSQLLFESEHGEEASLALEWSAEEEQETLLLLEDEKDKLLFP